MMNAQFDGSDFGACVFSVNGRCGYRVMSKLSLLLYCPLSHLPLVVLVLRK